MRKHTLSHADGRGKVWRVVRCWQLCLSWFDLWVGLQPCGSTITALSELRICECLLGVLLRMSSGLIRYCSSAASKRAICLWHVMLKVLIFTHYPKWCTLCTCFLTSIATNAGGLHSAFPSVQCVDQCRLISNRRGLIYQSADIIGR